MSGFTRAFVQPPSFQARRGGGNQTGIVPGVWTKAQLNNEEWDVGGYFDNATNYRYTPLIAGKYQVNFQLTFLTMPSGVTIMCAVYKGAAGSTTEFKRGRNIAGTTNAAGVGLSCLVDMNGSTDCLEFYGYHEAVGNEDYFGGATTETYASAIWVAP